MFDKEEHEINKRGDSEDIQDEGERDREYERE